ncbi:MAG: flagellar biosynthetic protein FliR [Granulosicoccus sp.]|jgi:flagellar biosynthetic protein FliR
MDAVVNIPFILLTMLVFTRCSALLLLSPLFSIARVPVRIKVFLLISLSALLVASLNLRLPEATINSAQLLYYAVSELVIGAAMAFGLFAAFASFSLGGRILDFQMGFGIASLLDPATNAQAPMIGTLLNMIAVMVFFLVDGHHVLIRGVAYTLSQYPPGSMPSIDINIIVKQFGLMFVYGVMLAAPVMFTILLIDISMGIAARTMPQVNMFIVMMPLKIAVGLLVLMLSLKFLLPLMKKVYISIFAHWQQLFFIDQVI